MNTKLDDLVTQHIKKSEVAAFSSKSPPENDSQIFELKCNKRTSEQHKLYVGIELTYLDHRTRTQELGVFLFEPNSEFMDILTIVGKINANHNSRHSDLSKLQYTIGDDDPLAA